MKVTITWAKDNDHVYGEREQIVFTNVETTGFSYGYAYIVRTDIEKRLNEDAFPFIKETDLIDREDGQVIVDHIPLTWIIACDVEE